MKGDHLVVVRNNKVQIKLPICRNITILQGKSATGKTTLIDLIAQHEALGESSGVTINCDVPCRVLAGAKWQRDLADIEDSIVFIDEDNAFMKTHELRMPRGIAAITTFSLLERRCPSCRTVSMRFTG